ncbi:MAG TPA: phosphonoacetaldehyde hydrolase [Candidatus Saccharimonadales bacterium]|nr:phosphonoacetaldehyde hydrolase [Candidatus Saccharimonadales bacterium]
MKLKAIIFDWAGTVVDFGSLCPARAIQAAFSSKQIDITAQDIHRFMGIRKREHVQTLLSLPHVSAQWRQIHGREPNSEDVQSLYEESEKRMIESVANFATLTPGLPEALTMVQHRGFRIGSTTGYTSPMMERLAPAAKRNGFNPEFWVASDQVPVGRPWPWMIYKNMEHLEICPPAAVIKLGDTVADVEEANNAGVWSVAVVESSSLVGRARGELETLPRREHTLLIKNALTKLSEAGAHFVIRNLFELEAVIEQIDERLAKGQTPPRFIHHTENGRESFQFWCQTISRSLASCSASAKD